MTTPVQSALDAELAEAMYALNRALSYFPNRSAGAVKQQQLLDMRDHVASIRMQLDTRPSICRAEGGSSDLPSEGQREQVPKCTSAKDEP